MVHGRCLARKTVTKSDSKGRSERTVETGGFLLQKGMLFSGYSVPYKLYSDYIILTDIEVFMGVQVSRV